MAISTKRKKIFKSKLKNMTKSKLISKSRKYLTKFKKNKFKTKKMRGGDGETYGFEPPHLKPNFKLSKSNIPQSKLVSGYPNALPNKTNEIFRGFQNSGKMIQHPFIVTPFSNFRVHNTKKYLVNENSDLSTHLENNKEVFKGFNE